MIPFKTVAFHTLGCKLNFSETSTLARQFEEEGFARVSFEEKADIYVINTCSVTENADKKCAHVVKQAKQSNPESFVAVTGCYAQLKPEDVANISGVNLVLGANEKFNMTDYLAQHAGQRETGIYRDKIQALNTFSPAHSAGDRTRSFLKVQDGCDYFCSFCTIPLARGKSRNAPIEATIQEARKAEERGVQEIILTGVNIGDFGQSTGESFFDLIVALDRELTVPRIRISSIEPNLLTDEIIDWVATSQRLMPHFHIPLQSGCDKTLKKMRRKYDTALYSRRIESIRRKMPEACIGVDVITGFPGETQEDFLRSHRYIEALPISYLHVFTYSERAQTTANKLDGSIPYATRKERSQQLRLLSEKKKRAFYLRFANQTADVLFEAGNPEKGLIQGFSSNYLKVSAPYDPKWVNTIQPVQLGSLNANNVFDGIAPHPSI